MNYYSKYLKYKTKYLELKGGGSIEKSDLIKIKKTLNYNGILIPIGIWCILKDSTGRGLDLLIPNFKNNNNEDYIFLIKYEDIHNEWWVNLYEKNDSEGTVDKQTIIDHNNKLL
jgi:hypothetical protein